MEQKQSGEQKVVSRAVGILRSINPQEINVKHRTSIAYAIGLLEAVILANSKENENGK